MASSPAMSTRDLVVLGTASQVPTRYRNHNGYLLRWDDEGFLFDPGEGTQRQMIYAEVAATAVTRVCITHFHGDHCLGLAGISQRISLDGAPHLVHAYYPASGQLFYERLRHASIYHDVGRWQAHPIDADGVVDATPAWTLSARALDHGVDTYGYRLQEADQRTLLPDRLAAAGITGPAVGQLLAAGRLELGDRVVTVDEVSAPRPGQSVAFVMDTRMCDAAIELARGVDLLICESTFLSADADKARAFGHLTATDAATIAREAQVGRLVLTHFSQRYPDEAPFLAEAAAIFPAVTAVRDGDVVPMPRRQRAR
jgi:ribonuclease Z